MSQSIIKNHEIEDFLCPIYKTLQLDGTQKKKKKQKKFSAIWHGPGVPHLSACPGSRAEGFPF